MFDLNKYKLNNKMSVCLLIPNGNFTFLLEIFLITILISTFIPCEF